MRATLTEKGFLGLWFNSRELWEDCKRKQRLSCVWKGEYELPRREGGAGDPGRGRSQAKARGRSQQRLFPEVAQLLDWGLGCSRSGWRLPRSQHPADALMLVLEATESVTSPKLSENGAHVSGHIIPGSDGGISIRLVRIPDAPADQRAVVAPQPPVVQGLILGRQGSAARAEGAVAEEEPTVLWSLPPESWHISPLCWEPLSYPCCHPRLP